jgi:hypothetical protein
MLTEADVAERWRASGFHTVCHRGRYWLRHNWGFHEPVHYLACLKAEEANPPSLACWGYRTSLHPDAAALANGFMAAYVLSDVSGYSIECLPAKRRTDLRKCRKVVQMVHLTDSALLLEQGYEVAVSSATRLGLPSPADRDRYRDSIRSLGSDPKSVVLAGLVGDVLAGYLVGSAVDGTAYIDSVIIATEHLPTAVGTGLAFDFVQVCQRTPGVQRIVYGLHSIELPKLTTFKLGMQFPVVHYPCRYWIAPILRTYIRRTRPYAYYRISGELPGDGERVERVVGGPGGDEIGGIRENG